MSQPTIRAIIGSSSDDDTIALSTASKRHEMPIVGYVAESSLLSEKVASYRSVTVIACLSVNESLNLLRSLQSSHPYFSRVSFGDKARFFAEGAYLASHHWDRVVGSQAVPRREGELFNSCSTVVSIGFDLRWKSGLKSSRTHSS